MATLDGGRIGIAAQALGIAEGALDETVAYVKERKQFGRSIAQFQNTQFELAEMKAVSYTHLDVYKRQVVDTLADGTLYELCVSVADGGAFDLSEAEKEIKISVVLAK